MKLVTVQSGQLQETAVNPDQVTFLRRDTYGTAIHLTSGEHIICSLDLEELKARLGVSEARSAFPLHDATS